MSFADTIRSLVRGDEIVIFHEFHKPPYGGGNQFLMALRKELRHRGFRVGNRVGRDTKAVLMNSFNFNPDAMRRAKRKYPKLRIVHRLAGPIGIYRGTDTEIDDRTHLLNEELADATIFQSQYSLTKYRELGLEFKNPVVIRNTVDPDIFNPKGRLPPPAGKRKVRLIATAWSDNPKKGGPLLAWLDEHLDHSRFELTFVGRTKAVFKNARVIAPVPSEKLADILRQQDVYIAPSQDDPCSNGLLEALACGLPVAYLKSGGHPELVSDGGVGFSTNDGLLSAISQIAENWQTYHDNVSVEALGTVANKYLNVLT